MGRVDRSPLVRLDYVMPTLQLSGYLKLEHFIWDLPSLEKPALLVALAEAAVSRVAGIEAVELLVLIEQREAVQSTGIGQGLAIPHAMVPGLVETALIVGRIDPAADYEALDGAPVDLVFMLLSPVDGLKVHLRLLARLARIVGQDEVLDLLRKASGPEDALRILLEEDARHVY